MKIEARFCVDDDGKTIAELLIIPTNDGECALLEAVFGPKNIRISADRQYQKMDYMERSIYGMSQQKLKEVILEVRSC